MKIKFRTGWNAWKTGDVVESVSDEQRKKDRNDSVPSITEATAKDLVARRYADAVDADAE